MKFLPLLLLAGCATASVDDLYSRARACETGCDALWEEYSAAVERVEKRKRERLPKCPPGYIWYCDHWSCHGNRPMTRGYCIESREFSRIFR